MADETNNKPTETEEIPSNFIIGIDLGTTNSAISYINLASGGPKSRKIEFLNIPQLSAPGELCERPVLPSFLYLPGEYDMPAGSAALPWDANRKYAVGEIAREQGALVPGRLVSSAKSWLCHGGVDRTANILPWTKDTDIAKVSPVEASSRYLQHIKEAWNETIAKKREGYLFEEQSIIITVPASFDEVARELTVKAAQKAGIERVKLMEEPLAAFYSWLYQNKNTWQKKMSNGQVILVCDVGGGTTDFTVIAVVEGENGLKFNRLSVGDHLMLGGDNMDLTIARNIEMQLKGKPGQLDSKRWHQLTHQCRKAKESLLTEEKDKPDVDITLMGTGGKLIADTLKCKLGHDQIEQLIIDGFFPFLPLDEPQQDGKRKGLTEWGLPYVQNPRVTSHLASFWQNSRPLIEQETGRETPYPDYLLFNGGALTPSVIRKRIQAVVKKWFDNEAGETWQPEELANPRPELAVAVGAVNYGIAKLFNEIQVGSGSPRAYYVEIASKSVKDTESASESDKRRNAICLVPRNSEEGFETKLNEPAFEVLTNQPVAFNVFSSSTRLDDKIGGVVALADSEITLLPPIHTVLKYGKKGEAKPLPVNISVKLTEVGTLELWCNSQDSDHQWQLQFDARLGDNKQAQTSASNETLDTATIEQAESKIVEVFKTKDKGNPELLIKDLATVINSRKEKWATPMIRKIADMLFKCRQGRTFSPQHEARWLNLAGFCSRPGFGDPLDDWRIKEIWKLFLEGLTFKDKHQCLSEWWILWRRIAGGLKAGQQMEIYKQLAPYLQSSDNKKKKSWKNPKSKSSAHDELEIWMTLASFERLNVDLKEKLGQKLLKKFRFGTPGPKELWSLSRLGSRVPFHGPLDKIIGPGEVTRWIKEILSKDPEPSEALAHALAQLARTTGDRDRDLAQPDLDALFAWLDKVPKGNHYKDLINDPESAMDQSEQDWIFGESLPPGIVISTTE